MVMPRTGFESLASPVSSIDIGGGASGRFGQTPMGSPMNVVVNMPAGSDGDAVVRSLQDYARKNGAVPVAVDDTRRF